MSGMHPWEGKIFGLAFYTKEWNADDIRRHYQAWRANGNFSIFRGEGPRLLYAFDEGGGTVVHEKTGAGPDLEVPAIMNVLKKKVLSFPRWNNIVNTNMIEDMAMNLIGFIPLGAILMATMSLLGGIGRGYSRLIVVIIAFVFSLSIEIAQVWIPSRDSSLMDLMLNTLGGVLGMLLFEKIRMKKTAT